MNFKKKYIQIFGLFLIGVFTGLIICDRILYNYPDYLPIYIKRIMLMPFSTIISDITRSDAFGSYTLKPDLNISATFGKNNTFNFTTKNFINGAGFRTQTFNTQNLITGNSFTFGYGLNDNETIDYLLKQRYGVEFFNAGVPGYSFKHSYLLYKNYFMQYKPKNVIYLFVYNDIKEAYYFNEFKKAKTSISQFKFQANERVRMRKYKLEDSAKRLSTKFNYSNLRYYINWRSPIYNIIKNSFNGKLFNTYFQVIDSSDLESYTNVTEYPLNVAAAEFKVSLIEWNEDVKKGGGVFSVVYIPYKEEINNTYKNINYKKFRNFVENVCVENQIPFLSLLEPLKNSAYCFFEFDDHINKIGAGIVADEIYNFALKK